MQRLIILDRDGVINQDKGTFVTRVEDWLPIPGSLEAITRLNQNGFKVAVATNQSCVGRGLIGIDTLNAIHARMHQMLSRVGGHIDGIFVCPHTPEENCDCRKPNPGLYQAIGHRFDASLHGVPVIGDSLRDLQAAQAVDALPLLVKTGHGLATLNELPAFPPQHCFDDLAHAVEHVLTEQQ